MDGKRQMVPDGPGLEVRPLDAPVADARVSYRPLERAADGLVAELKDLCARLSVRAYA